jgi:asparagine synthase (glutamine-hydrolysing)
MSYRDRYWLIFNGEVYNYIELRSDLVKRGYEFVTASDSEVILAAYAEWGPACLSRFNGMWALAIFDRAANTLFLARDRFGVKPLYYRLTNGSLAFASEIKAFTALADWSAKANRTQFMDFLVWGLIDHTTDTLFDGVWQLGAGHYLLLDLTEFSGQASRSKMAMVQPQRWYDYPPPSAEAPREAAEELRAALEDAVRLRLRSDVPVGSCLSGGLDSSAIVCLMSREFARAGVKGTLKTFTARSPDKAFDESDYAAAVVKTCGAEANYITPTPEILLENLDRLIWHQDSPLISGSTIAQWMIFREARKQGVIVMLDGQGADEILCGYRGFFGAFLAGLMRQGRVAAWWREAGAMRRESGFPMMRAMGYTAAYLRPELVGWLGRFDHRAYSDREWLHESRRSAYGTDPVRTLGGRANSVREMSTAQVAATNLPMLLHWEDRNSMAFSVEARVPFLDYRVVELCLRMKDEDKLGGGLSKAALRHSMRGIVPDRVLDRRDKMGFVTAESLWMRRDMAPRFRAELLAAVKALPEIVDPTILDRFDEMLAGRRSFDHRYWRVITAARWAEVFSAKI